MKKEIRQKVWLKYDKHCSYCGKEIEYKDMQVDHLRPKANCFTKQHHLTINDFSNLMPSCRSCNHYKRANPLGFFRIMMKTIHERIMKTYIAKVANDYGVLDIKPFDGEFYFEKISKHL